MKWKKINLQGETWYGKQQCLLIEHKKWADPRPPCQIGSAANKLNHVPNLKSVSEIIPSPKI